MDENIARKIVDNCDIHSDQCAVEIGPGLGALTRHLAQRARHVLAVDIDRGLQGPLQEVLRSFSNVTVLFDDILSVDIETQLQKSMNLEILPTYKVCGNIPYNITSPIIFHLLEHCPHMKEAVLMVQKEVAMRIMAGPGTKDYGLLTITTSYHSQVDLLMKVSNKCFYPQPEVESAVIRLRPLDGKRVRLFDEKRFMAFLRAAFQKRRKTILNISSEFFAIDKVRSVCLLEEMGLSPQARPENLTIEEFARLVNGMMQEV